MKCLLICVLGLATTLGIKESTFDSKWTTFKNTHGKKYSESEDISRSSIFERNLEEIQEHNEKYSRGEVSYFKKITKFSDWSKNEFQKYINRGVIKKSVGSERRETYVPSGQPLAATVDWRETAVTPVRDQGKCNAPWAFSAIGSVEGQVAIAGKGLVPLSVQTLIDCSNIYYNEGCDGGWLDQAFQFIRDYGIMTEESSPYEARDDRRCKFDPYHYFTNISTFVDIPSRNEQALADACARNGPVAISFITTPAYQHYGGGILIDETCPEYLINHAALVVGYGTEDEQDYWLVKNSWGTAWGENGYIKIARNANNLCAVASSASYAVL